MGEGVRNPMIARVFSAQPSVLGAHIVTIETDLSRGLYSFSVVGLPDKAVEEARDRMSAAIKNTGFESPKGTNHKIIISLAPADLRKEGPLFDLPIAIGVLAASEQLLNKEAIEKYVIMGELSLDGELRSIKGALPIAIQARKEEFKGLILPKVNAKEAGMVNNLNVYGVENIKDTLAQ